MSISWYLQTFMNFWWKQCKIESIFTCFRMFNLKSIERSYFVENWNGYYKWLNNSIWFGQYHFALVELWSKHIILETNQKWLVIIIFVPLRFSLSQKDSNMGKLNWQNQIPWKQSTWDQCKVRLFFNYWFNLRERKMISKPF